MQLSIMVIVYYGDPLEIRFEARVNHIYHNRKPNHNHNPHHIYVKNNIKKIGTPKARITLLSSSVKTEYGLSTVQGRFIPGCWYASKTPRAG